MNMLLLDSPESQAGKIHVLAIAYFDWKDIHDMLLHTCSRDVGNVYTASFLYNQTTGN